MAAARQVHLTPADTYPVAAPRPVPPYIYDPVTGLLIIQVLERMDQPKGNA